MPKPPDTGEGSRVGWVARMIGDIDLYLIDTNAVFKLSDNQRASPSFRQISKLPSEVVYEAGVHADTDMLRDLDFGVTASVLRSLQKVMKSVGVDDFDLVDLYKNKGAADPLLVACAVEARERREGALVGDVYTVVTADEAVQRKCDEFSVPWESPEAFASRLDNV